MDNRALPLKPCRDCGHLLGANERGCPRCAMNVEAERMIDLFVWRRLLPGLIGLAIFAVVVMFYLLR